MALTLTPELTSVIVVTADSGELARECIARVLASDVALELLVVDNASTDGEPERLHEKHSGDPRFRLLRNTSNLGFGAACNRGAVQAHGDALLFLNPDCLIEPATLAQLRAVAAEHGHTGVFGVHVLQPSGQPERAIRRREPTLRRALMTASGLARWESQRPGLAGVAMPGRPDAPLEVERVDAVSGACLYVRREAFDRVGGFDEGYFLHCEDLDLCRRIRDAGWQVEFVPTVKVMHAQGSSSRSRPLFVARHKHRSLWRYFRTHDPAARHLALRIAVWCAIWVHFLVSLPGTVWRSRRRRGFTSGI